jgi:hypothetical protein
MILFAAGGYFVAKKVKNLGEGAMEDPALAVAKLAVAANPELEIVASDPEAGKLTLRNTRTGEEMVFDYEDIKEGRLHFETEGEEAVSFDFSGEGEDGLVKVTGKDGETVFEAGMGSVDDLPAWIPLYPNTEPEGIFSSSRASARSGAFSLKTDDPVDQVAEHFATALEEAGFILEKSVFSSGAGEGVTLTGESEEPKRTVNVGILSQGEGTQIAIHYSEGE